jgi:PAS domain S-box-containing protein
VHAFAPQDTPELPSSTAPVIRVLLIEDSATDQRFFGAMLRRFPQVTFEVTCVDRVATAIKELHSRQTDVVLLDLGLPDSWGLDTFLQVRHAAPHLPIIVLTGSEDEALAVHAVRAGAQDFLVKGHVDSDVLGRAIRYARERHAGETALRRSEERYRDLVENLNEVVAAIDAQGVITYISPAATRLGGYDPADIVGHHFEAFIHPPDLPELLASFARTIAGHLEPSEFRLLTKSGELRWVHSSSRPVRDSEGRITGLQMVAMDISARKQAEAEVQRLNADLERRVAERTAEVIASQHELETLVDSLAHDLRTPLRAVDGFCQILTEDYAPQLDGTGRDHLERVRGAAQRMGRLIDGLLQVSQVARQDIRREPVDLSACARRIAADLRHAHPERPVAFVIAEGLTASGDPQLLEILLRNLFDNAWKFTAKHATARIEFGLADRAWPMADGRIAEPGRGGGDDMPSAISPQRVFFVRDHGVGFDMAYADKLFRPFQRLHAASDDDGAGIGLAMAQRIVQRHGGRIWAHAGVERGATFFFTLNGGTVAAREVQNR